MTYASSINTALAASAVLSASNAHRARRAFEAVVQTEFESVAQIVSQKDAFREAAVGMMADVTRQLASGLTGDLRDIRVREGLFSVSKTAVPVDVLSSARTEAQAAVNEIVRDAFKEGDNLLSDIAEYGLLDEDEETFYEPGTGSLLIHDLNNDDATNIAKIGVVHIVQRALEEADMRERSDGETRQKYRALGVAFDHALNNAWDICEKIREPAVKAFVRESDPAP